MTDVVIRPAVRTDVPPIVAMLADDPLGATREDITDMAPYLAAFDRIAADPAQHLLVASRAGQLLGTLQLTLIPGLSRRGSTRALIEAVRVADGARGEGLGTVMIDHATDLARSKGAVLIQLTSDISRADAHRFYDRLGFERSHFGFKKLLRP